MTPNLSICSKSQLRVIDDQFSDSMLGRMQNRKSKENISNFGKFQGIQNNEQRRILFSRGSSDNRGPLLTQTE